MTRWKHENADDRAVKCLTVCGMQKRSESCSNGWRAVSCAEPWKCPQYLYSNAMKQRVALPVIAVETSTACLRVAADQEALQRYFQTHSSLKKRKCDWARRKRESSVDKWGGERVQIGGGAWGSIGGWEVRKLWVQIPMRSLIYFLKFRGWLYFLHVDDVRWIGLVWLRIGTGGELLWTR
jgi:hypothetical protein